jgi:integrase
MTRRASRWSYEAPGSYRGLTVAVYEESNGMLYGREGLAGASRRQALKHQDKDRAKAWARARLKELVLGQRILEDVKPLAARIFTAYLEIRTPRKQSARSRQADIRASELWQCILGADRDVTTITERDWGRFIDARKSGAIDPRGKPVEKIEDRRELRDRAIAADLQWLRDVLAWGTRTRDEQGRYYLRDNPVRGFEIPREKNPRRPVASTDRYDALQKVAAAVHPFLPVLLALAYGTGRRLTAFLTLRYQDLRLQEGPQGAICWPAASDKRAREWSAPLNAETRAVLDRHLEKFPGIGAAHLFPAPRRTGVPVSRYRASIWLKRAEKRAGLDPLKGSLWHAYRRSWATARKHLPLKDVAAAGGWKSLAVVQDIYQQADAATLQRVVSDAVELREKQA